MKSSANLHQQSSTAIAGQSVGRLIKRAQQLTGEEFQTAFQVARESCEKDLRRERVFSGAEQWSLLDRTTKERSRQVLMNDAAGYAVD